MHLVSNFQKTQKNTLSKTFHNKQQAKEEMDGYRFFLAGTYCKKKKEKKESREEKKQTQKNRLCN